MSTVNTVTEQLTRAGQVIEHDSFAIIDREAGPHFYTAEQWPIVRRMIHANADFDFNGLTRFHPDAVRAGRELLLNARAQGGAHIVADVEMICVGLSAPRLAHFGVQTHQFISDEDVIEQAKAEDSTRAVQAMRKAQRLGLIDGQIVAIGNAPTALIELVRMIREEGARPALVIGMPVGFVSAAESKALLMEVKEVPWIAIQGRKGGSTLVVAALHALLALAEAEQKKAGSQDSQNAPALTRHSSLRWKRQPQHRVETPLPLRQHLVLPAAPDAATSLSAAPERASRPAPAPLRRLAPVHWALSTGRCRNRWKACWPMGSACRLPSMTGASRARVWPVLRMATCRSLRATIRTAPMVHT